jgi:hypothetical protein
MGVVDFSAVCGTTPGLVPETPVLVAEVPVLVAEVPVLVDVGAGDFPAAGGVPGTADVALLFAAPVKGVDLVWVAA